MNRTALVVPVVVVLLMVAMRIERNKAVDFARTSQCETTLKIMLPPLIEVRCVMQDGNLLIRLKNMLTQQEETYYENGQRVD